MKINLLDGRTTSAAYSQKFNEENFFLFFTSPLLCSVYAAQSIGRH